MPQLVAHVLFSFHKGFIREIKLKYIVKNLSDWVLNFHFIIFEEILITHIKIFLSLRSRKFLTAFAYIKSVNSFTSNRFNLNEIMFPLPRNKIMAK